MTVDLTNLRNLAAQMREKTHASQASGRSWFQINNMGSKSEIYVYDSIGEFGVSAGDFVNELKNTNANEIDLHINSEGGQVFDGLAIYESIRQHPAYVTAFVDGLAASAASFIVQAADRRVMARNARMMVHDAHGMCIGNAATMKEMAELLDNFSDNLADIYAERAGGSKAKWRKAMKGPNDASDGTWYNAQEAVNAGLADEVAASPNKTSENPANTQTQNFENAAILQVFQGLGHLFPAEL